MREGGRPRLATLADAGLLPAYRGQMVAGVMKEGWTLGHRIKGILAMGKVLEIDQNVLDLWPSQN